MINRIDLSVQNLISAYSQGIFPMGDENGVVNWYEADPRGYIPLQHLHIPHDLKRVLKQGKFTVTLNKAFRETITACSDRPEPTWITSEIIDAYVELHKYGHGHSIETWIDGALVGGLYGVSLGAAFFGESMFYRQRDASKIALAHLWVWLARAGFSLFDIQMVTDVLKRFGARKISKEKYLQRLDEAIKKKCVLQAVKIDWHSQLQNMREV